MLFAMIQARISVSETKQFPGVGWRGTHCQRRVTTEDDQKMHHHLCDMFLDSVHCWIHPSFPANSQLAGRRAWPKSRCSVCPSWPGLWFELCKLDWVCLFCSNGHNLFAGHFLHCFWFLFAGAPNSGPSGHPGKSLVARHLHHGRTGCRLDPDWTLCSVLREQTERCSEHSVSFYINAEQVLASIQDKFLNWCCFFDRRWMGKATWRWWNGCVWTQSVPCPVAGLREMRNCAGIWWWFFSVIWSDRLSLLHQVLRGVCVFQTTKPSKCWLFNLYMYPKFFEAIVFKERGSCSAKLSLSVLSSVWCLSAKTETKAINVRIFSCTGKCCWFICVQHAGRIAKVDPAVRSFLVREGQQNHIEQTKDSFELILAWCTNWYLDINQNTHMYQDTSDLNPQFSPCLQSIQDLTQGPRQKHNLNPEVPWGRSS